MHHDLHSSSTQCKIKTGKVQIQAPVLSWMTLVLRLGRARDQRRAGLARAAADMLKLLGRIPRRRPSGPEFCPEEFCARCAAVCAGSCAVAVLAAVLAVCRKLERASCIGAEDERAPVRTVEAVCRAVASRRSGSGDRPACISGKYVMSGKFVISVQKYVISSRLQA